MTIEFADRESTSPVPQCTRGPNILLIDDDVDLCVLMSEYFSQGGYRFHFAHDGARGLAEVRHGGFDLVVLDVMLPVLDGFEVLYQIRSASIIPVIMLTARTQERDRIAGLDAGADDYLPKPFGPDELLARIRALLRRTGQANVRAEEITIGRLRLNTRARKVWIENRPVELTSVEFDILSLLVRSAGRVLSRDEIAAMVYHREATCCERSADVHISHLRKKLESGGEALIQTIRGVGYLFSLDA